MPDDLRLGVDLGGTKTEAVVVRLRGEETPEILARHRVPTPRDEEYAYEAVIASTAAIVKQVAADAGLSELPKIGCGMPGSVTASGTIKNSNTTCLNGRPFRSDLVARVGEPIVFANDANCFALAEATYGAARGAEVAFGVIMGTGVGGGLVLRGRAWDGAQGIAGEWGHVVLEPASGPQCYCGKRGCVETFLSGPAIERAYAEKTGTKRALVDIGTLDDATLERFGRALATVIDIVDPDVIVLGGGVSNLSILYGKGIEAVARWVFNDELRTRIVKHEIGDSAGVFGAALLP
jgi:fructokinase